MAGLKSEEGRRAVELCLPGMRPVPNRLCFLLALIWLGSHPYLLAHEISRSKCPRPEQGSVVSEPEDLRSIHGELKVELTISNEIESDGSTRYCYLDQNGDESPNLRVKPGDLVVIHLKNNLTPSPSGASAKSHHMPRPAGDTAACPAGSMTAVSTNLHFHGLTIPPVCHQDDVLKTSTQPGDPPFEYRFRIPADADRSEAVDSNPGEEL